MSRLRELCSACIVAAVLLATSAAPAGHSTNHLNAVSAAVAAQRAEIPPDATGATRKRGKFLDKLGDLLSKHSVDLKGDLKISKKAASYAVRKKLYSPAPNGAWIYEPFGDAQRGFWDELTALESAYRARLAQLADTKPTRAAWRKADAYDYFARNTGGQLNMWGIAIKQLKALRKLKAVRKAVEKAERKTGAAALSSEDSQ